jgi:hypothetical protein
LPAHRTTVELDEERAVHESRHRADRDTPRWAPVGEHEGAWKHLQRFGNLFVIGLLRSPLHRPASGSLLLITYRGRRSGRHFTIPAMYAEHDGAPTIFVGHPERKRWWRNLRVGAEVEVRLRGRRLRGQGAVVEDVAALENHLDR